MERIHYVGSKFFGSKILNIFNIINYISERRSKQDKEGKKAQHEVETYRRSECETVVVVEIVACFPNNFQKFVLFNKIQKFFPNIVQNCLL